jgi:Man1-Src1p-C-terminal domain
MPPKKRKAEEEAKKPTKAEKTQMKAEVKFRAEWVSTVDGSDGSDFDKTWKEWIDAGNEPDAFRVPGRPSKSKRRKTTSPAKKPATPAKKPQAKKEQKEIATARAAALAAEDLAESAKKPPAENPTPTSIPAPIVASAIRPASARSARTGPQNETENIISDPPRQFPTFLQPNNWATTPPTPPTPLDSFPTPQTNAGINGNSDTPSADAYLNPDSIRVQVQPSINVPHNHEQKDDVPVHHAAVEEASGPSVMDQMLRASRGLARHVGLPLLAMGFLCYCLSTKKYGIWMISGVTRQHCSTNYIGRCRLEPPYIAVTEEETPIAQFAQRCYYDSPEHLLEMLNLSAKESTVELASCSDGIQQCPLHAICYKGHMMACQAPAWVMGGKDGDDTDNPAACVLSKAVNDTYSGLVQLLESWSVQYLCFNRAQVPTPNSFYTFTKNEKDPFKDIAVVPADDTTAYGFMSSSDGGIPLYPWTNIYRMIEAPEELEGYWDWSLLQSANDAHKKQLVLLDDESGDVHSVGLTPIGYSWVEQAKLPTGCNLARGIVHSFDWCGRFVLSLFTGLLGMIVYCFRMHPYISLSIHAVVTLVWYWRYRNEKYNFQRKLVNEIRKKVVQKLRAAMNTQQSGAGMHRGEVAAIHLRDEICFDMHDDEKKRAEFKSTVWPLVCYEIHCDNRVGKSHRMVNGAKRDLWMWVATPEAGKEVSQT